MDLIFGQSLQSSTMIILPSGGFTTTIVPNPEIEDHIDSDFQAALIVGVVEIPERSPISTQHARVFVRVWSLDDQSDNSQRCLR